MTFTLTDSSGGSRLTLAHGAGRPTDTYAQGPTGAGSYASAQKVDEWPLTRSDYALVLPRKNHSADRPFGAVRTFATEGDAEMWAVQHALAVQGLTRLVFANGGYTMRLHGAMATCECLVQGVAVSVSYSFRYGRVEAITAPTILTSANLPVGVVGTPYSQSLSADGGTGPYVWELDGGSLPGGLSLSSAGAITGTPTTAGTYRFAVCCTDAAAAFAIKTFVLIITET